MTTAKPKAAAKAPAISAAVATPALKIEAAWGIDASIDDGYLHLRQRDLEGGVDEIVLSRAEVSRLFNEFEEWATCSS